MPTKPRILHVIDHTDSGGAQVQMADRMSDLKDQFEFSVAVLGRTGDFSSRYKQMGIPVVELAKGRNRWNLAVFFSLLRLVKSEKPDIIYAHLFKSMILSSFAAFLTGTACILRDHSGLNRRSLQFYFPNLLVRSLFSLAFRLAIKLSDHVVVFNEIEMQDYTSEFNVPQAKLDFLPNSINIVNLDSSQFKFDLRKELNLSEKTRIIIMVGRLAPEKDWPTFIEVAERFPDPQQCSFVAIGGGQLDASLRELALDKGLKNFHFLGERKDVASLLGQADAFLLTSKQESFGLVILEAMAAGCPVISSRTTGASSIIEHGRNGYLVDIGDVDGFTSALKTILSDTKLAKDLINNARSSLGEYSPQKVSEKLANIFNKVILDRGMNKS
ncbi:MAG: glycosyltransferase family 4 protein [Anaerolineales bacterium]